jgi:hypothetical protein
LSNGNADEADIQPKLDSDRSQPEADLLTMTVAT